MSPGVLPKSLQEMMSVQFYPGDVKVSFAENVVAVKIIASYMPTLQISLQSNTNLLLKLQMQIRHARHWNCLVVTNSQLIVQRF